MLPFPASIPWRARPSIVPSLRPVRVAERMGLDPLMTAPYNVALACHSAPDQCYEDLSYAEGRVRIAVRAHALASENTRRLEPSDTRIDGHDTNPYPATPLNRA